METSLAREKETRQIYDAMNDFLYFYDMAGNFLEINAACEKALGRRVSPNESFNVKDIVPEPFHGEVDEFLENIRSMGADRGYIRVKAADGRSIILEHNSVLLCDEAGTPLGVRGIARDVTESFFNKRALEKSEKRYREILENIAEGYYEIDLQGNLKFFNAAFAGMLGWSEETLAGGNYRDFLDNADAQALFQSFNTVFRTGQPAKALEWRLHRKDGSYCHMEASISLIRDEATGKPSGFRGITRDVTTRVEATERQKALEARLAAAQRMEAIGALSGGIAHDFNNILFPIIGYTEMAIADLPEEAPARESLEKVLQSAYRARDLVRQILTFGREQEESAAEPVALQSVIHEIISFLRKTTPSSIEIKVDVDEDAPAVRMLATRLQRLVMNLCTNAVQAMAPLEIGTLSVTLAVKDVSADDVEARFGLTAGPHVRLTVSDTGPGIAEEIRDKIFEPYFSTKPRDKGSGLGLSIVWGIVKNAGGAILLKNPVDGGALFEVYLPVAPEQKESGTDAEAIEPRPESLPFGSETILLVDDDQEIVLVEKRVFENLGYTVVPRTSSIEALEAFKFNPDRFDLVMTDHIMPNMTGLMLAKAIKEIRPDIPVIICTGFSEQLTGNKVANAGIRQVLMKPVSIHDLAYAVREAIDDEA